MDTFPEFEEDGSEELSYENIWRNIEPQEIVGVDCFNPNVPLRETDNLVTLNLTATEFKEMFSALYNGAEITYPDSFMQIIVNFLRGIHCPPLVSEGECTEFPPNAPFIGYLPINPYIDPDTVPDGYLTQPFKIVDDSLDDDTGLAIGDIYVPLDAVTYGGGWFEDLSENLPTITINFSGTGKASIKLLTVGGGGLAIVTLDNPPNLVDILGGIVTGADNIVDLNKDIVSLPPETATEIDIPINVDSGGDHIIYIVFLPIIDDSFIPLRFGGGFRGVELCGLLGDGMTIDCDDIEDCLDSSETIAGINDSIVVLTDGVNDATNAIDQINDHATDGGVQAVIVPRELDEADNLCKASYYIASNLAGKLIEWWSNAATLTWLEFFEAGIGVLTWNVPEMKDFFDFYATASNPDLEDDALAYTDTIAQYLFCTDTHWKEAVSLLGTDDPMTADEISLWGMIINSVPDSQMDIWAAAARLDDEEKDCTGGCGWVVVYDPSGNYTPDATESQIISGDDANSWSIASGTFVSGQGWELTSGTLEISHNLPEQCRITDYQVSIRRGSVCLSTKWRVWYKGTDHISVEQWSGDNTVVSTTFVNQNLSAYGALLEIMKIQADNHTCIGSGSQLAMIEWIKITGTGARPRS